VTTLKSRDIQRIDKIAQHRSHTQAGLNSRNKQAYSKDREQPINQGYDNPIQFTQRPKMPANRVDNS